MCLNPIGNLEFERKIICLEKMKKKLFSVKIML